MIKKKPRFLRIGYTQYSKLGLRRKKKLKYRKSKGGENKIRLKMKGHLRNVSIGFRSEKNKRGLIKGMKPVSVSNIEELKKVNKNDIVIMNKMGNRKKAELAEYALKNNIRVFNVNPKKFLEQVKEKIEKRKQEKMKKSEKAKIKDKKEKEAEKKESKEEKKEEKETTENSVKNYESDIKENVEDKK